MTGCEIKGRQELEKAFSNICQAWSFDGVHLELSSDARNDAIVAFLHGHFLPYETLGKSLEWVDDFQDYDDDMRRMLADNLSILLVSDITDDVIGVRVITIKRKTDELLSSHVINKKFKTLLEFLAHKDEDMTIFKYYGVDTVVYFDGMAVHFDFRQRGYASKLMEAAIAFSKELGIDPLCIGGKATANYIQRVFEKCGFETLHEMKYDDYKIDGEVVFKNTGVHKSTKIYVKRL